MYTDNLVISTSIPSQCAASRLELPKVWLQVFVPSQCYGKPTTLTLCCVVPRLGIRSIWHSSVSEKRYRVIDTEAEVRVEKVMFSEATQKIVIEK